MNVLIHTYATSLHLYWSSFSYIILFIVFNAEVSDLFLWCYWKLCYFKNLISTCFSYNYYWFLHIYLHKWFCILSTVTFINSFCLKFSYTPEPDIECLIKICLFKFISQCYYLPTFVFMWWRVSKYLRTSLIMMSIVSRMKFWLSCCPLEWREVL